jgi:WD40 repeat protein
VWDVSSGEQQFTVHGYLWAWSADGSRVLTSEGYAVQVRDAETGKTLLDLSDPDWYEVMWAEWSPDERWIEIQLYSGGTRVMDAQTGAELLHLDGRATFAWNADGSRLVADAGDGTVRQYCMQVECLLPVACRRTTRNLTEEEWARFFPDQPYRTTCPD